MGFIYANIEIINAGDLEMVKRGYMDTDDVRRITVRSLVDTGAYTLCINQEIADFLQLSELEKRTSELATGEKVSLSVVGPIELKFKNRRATCSALVLPGDAEVLLGAIPMEDMDVVIDPRRQELVIPAGHEDGPLVKVK